MLTDSHGKDGKSAAMHTIWKGAISFGLVNIPVNLFAATEDKDVPLRMIHKTCGTPINYARKCRHCDAEVPADDIVKGYEYEPGRFVLLENEELEQLSEASREIRILDFVDLAEIDPIYFQKTYYLSPGPTGASAYRLLTKAMSDSGKIGVAKVSIRTKSSLAAIRVIGRGLALETMHFPDEIRPIAQVPNLPEPAEVNERELVMAKMLIEQLSSPFEPEKYTDDYRARLTELIDRKRAGQDIRVAPEPKRENVIDLMAALEASLEAIGRQRGRQRQTVAKPAGPAENAGAPSGSPAGRAEGTAAGTATGAGADADKRRTGGARRKRAKEPAT